MSNDYDQLLVSALGLLLQADSELWGIVAVSLKVSLTALLIALVPAIFLAYTMVWARGFPRKTMLLVMRTLQSFPTVVIGLILYLALSRQGFFGHLELLFTTKAMIIAQVLLAFPILVTLAFSGFFSLQNKAMETAITLGMGRWSRLLLMAWECRLSLVTALVTALARIITEVGCSMMVGGNILYVTRNIPTAIALETAKGNFAQGVALGIVMLTMALCLNFVMSSLDGQRPGGHYEGRA
ncbi:Tungstate uptake system permease protein TupB [Sinobacterium norvegicum]|uniref:Tungstate uptake system permease protein TupB n=1 Tax=Sinobacterium norvegicum TaxID=1641715 RepID=A0ABM9AHQ3_9GAMM|nr:ABC transporter permease [Sinobacterium norvegicum]CAH0992751.1 Tungstate uptake system permease protein TupB [Sinobacterium norvegicum]